MSKKSDAFYYDNFLQVSKICCEAAEFLVDFLTNYDANKITESIAKMHEFEHAADGKKHEMTEALSKAFITPLEREDLAQLSYNLDEVVDNIEEVLQRFYMDEFVAIRKDCILLAQKIVACCKCLSNMLEELHNFKKPEKLLERIVEISDTEEDCDKVYIDAYKNVRKECNDVLEVVAWRKVYDYLERCADSCEHVADTVELIVMKNT
ncbi:MAG: DUF47 family protein [Clostridia bacterium]|nr:DUF47 family protein [Clostridia bacterium]